MPKSNAELGAEIERLNDIVRRLGLDGEIPARTILQSNGLGGAQWYEYLYLPGNFVLSKDGGGSWRLGVDAVFFIQAGGGLAPKVQIGGSGAKEAGTHLWIDNSGNLTAANVLSGTYTPTLTNTTNIAASTAYVTHYMRVGNEVFVAGRVNIDPTAGGLVRLGMSLPIASNFTATEDVGGVVFCGEVAGQGGMIFGDVANDRVVMEFITADTANRQYYFTCGYRIR